MLRFRPLDIENIAEIKKKSSPMVEKFFFSSSILYKCLREEKPFFMVLYVSLEILGGSTIQM